MYIKRERYYRTKRANYTITNNLILFTINHRARLKILNENKKICAYFFCNSENYNRNVYSDCTYENDNSIEVR